MTKRMEKTSEPWEMTESIENQFVSGSGGGPEGTLRRPGSTLGNDKEVLAHFHFVTRLG